MTLIDLTRKLISIPSYVDLNSNSNERDLGEFIFNYLSNLGYLQVKKQYVEGERFNIIAHDDHPPRLMFCCHMDTVQLSGEWKHDPFDGEIEQDRLYGLGAVDMKGGLACVLYALASSHATKGLYLLIDVDEESEFKGIKKFLSEHKVYPELAIFPEPGTKIQNGHRGLIEVCFQVKGQTGHAARPTIGKNAIFGAVRAVEHLIEQLNELSDSELGSSTCNLAFLRGGIDKGSTSEGIQEIGSDQPNKIPDIAEVILDIRPAVASLRAQTVLDIITSYLTATGYNIAGSKKTHDYGSLLIPRQQFVQFETIVRQILGRVEYADLGDFGYGEAQLLNEHLGVNCVYFGPEPTEKAHQVDEYVSISSLETVYKVYKTLVEKYCY